MTNPYRNVIPMMILMITSLLSLFLSLIFSFVLFISLEVSNAISEAVKYNLTNFFILSNVLTSLYCLYLVGVFTDIALGHNYNKKGFHTKLRVIGYIFLFEIIVATVYVILLVYNVVKNTSIYLLEATSVILTLSLLMVAQYFCVERIHPDFWKVIRNNEIREMEKETFNEIVEL